MRNNAANAIMSIASIPNVPIFIRLIRNNMQRRPSDRAFGITIAHSI
jgi:hypothetical protein